MKTLESIREEIWEEMLRLEYKRKDQWVDIKYQTLREVLQKLGHLDEPEVLSQKWIDENKVQRIDNLRKMTTSDVIPVEKLKNLLVPKQDKPVIPQFVADWIERQMEFEYECVFLSMTRLRGNAPEKVKFWFDNNPDTYARAWMDGYEVEKEKLYTVDLPHSYELIKLLHTQTYRIKNYSESGFGDYTNTFTEAEIKKIDERLMVFAEEVKP